MNWFISFLCDRKLQTRIGSTLSIEIALNIGVPLFSQQFWGYLVVIADDVAFSYAANSIDEIKDKVVHDLYVRFLWFTSE